MSRNKRSQDMSNHEIRGELMKKGKSLSQLGVENGLAKTTVRNALDKPYPKGERIIAEALGMKSWDIWPSRYLNQD
ncbi:transcriptional regulatory protein [Haemophilus influenzae 3655]|uniref:Helix-turn-helix domain-containing protein n=1 Tax=Haemophilus influenzae (strain NTHi 3655) TaxID=375177 RepID=A0A0H3PCT9_HAEI3|nr:helix-turn-helix domain-containing protein [Haemophilus influenzae]EDJ92527.1 transcriptional regulatory protein [Haemophilus influenzae 3655]KOR03044.1 DNA-binding protein [Haemophilus influenzae]MCC3183010.1 helix-turn-helix domain-containing protein [Haemophilus influenzae]MCK8843203.1 helix-turn-helix domain-containing protein [Haemophilus influenzae]MCK8919791.1 helix-turn-helix domain-containing protein [Haemophilus influenzae]